MGYAMFTDSWTVLQGLQRPTHCRIFDDSGFWMNTELYHWDYDWHQLIKTIHCCLSILAALPLPNTSNASKYPKACCGQQLSRVYKHISNILVIQNTLKFSQLLLWNRICVFWCWVCTALGFISVGLDSLEALTPH